MGWMKREEEHESVSLTLLVFVVVVITVKLCLSGMTIEGYKFSDFSAMDWSTIFTPVAGLYFGQKIQHYKKKRGDEKKLASPITEEASPSKTDSV